jgi:hypothetical protein
MSETAVRLAPTRTGMLRRPVGRELARHLPAGVLPSEIVTPTGSKLVADQAPSAQASSMSPPISVSGLHVSLAAGRTIRAAQQAGRKAAEGISSGSMIPDQPSLRASRKTVWPNGNDAPGEQRILGTQRGAEQPLHGRGKRHKAG